MEQVNWASVIVKQVYNRYMWKSVVCDEACRAVVSQPEEGNCSLKSGGTVWHLILVCVCVACQRAVPGVCLG